MTDPLLSTFFQPRGIAVIGASQDATKLGYGLARNLVLSNYRGEIYFINPKGGMLFGRKIYTHILEVPEPVDLAILLIPAAAVPSALRQCGQRGLEAAIIGAGGFRETGPEGAALEAECLAVARKYMMRLIGPNCIGLLDTHLPIDATFLPPPGPPLGEIAFISHSGAICAAVIDWARGQGFGISRLVSLGNQVDVNESDALSLVADDPYTRVITLYLEGVANGRNFVNIACEVSTKKPIIAIKVGKYYSGRRAVASHTGALAGEDHAYNAAFRRAGVIRADTSEEMFDWARTLAWCPTPHGRAVGILTNAGGPGVTASDALEANGLTLADLSPETQASLNEALPPAASLQNPVDMLASATPEQYAACLRLLLADPGVHSVMVILPPTPMSTAGAVAKAVIPVIHQAEKPVVIALMGDRLIQEAVEHFRAAHIPEYRFPERAASALATLTKRGEYLGCAANDPLLFAEAHPEQVKAILESNKKLAEAESDGILLDHSTCQRVFEAYGIAPLKTHLAVSAQEAVFQARILGYPVTLKIASPDIPHKSDVDGVLLNLSDDQAVVWGFNTVMENARTARPDAEISGVMVQRMLPPGLETIVGAVQDPQFGPLVMFGSGGVEVERLNDTAFALAPIVSRELEDMVESTWVGRRLRGYRSIPPSDRQAVLDAIVRVAQLASDFPEFSEIEINPLHVLKEGKGAQAVDIRIRYKPKVEIV